MKYKNCDACKCGAFQYICTGVKNPFVILDINNDCTEYSPEYWTINKEKNSKIDNALLFLNSWIKTDIQELNGDISSDYAKFILDGHTHIKLAIECLEKQK